jgi:hypothetical protein
MTVTKKIKDNHSAINLSNKSDPLSVHMAQEIITTEDLERFRVRLLDDLRGVRKLSYSNATVSLTNVFSC